MSCSLLGPVKPTFTKISKKVFFFQLSPRNKLLASLKLHTRCQNEFSIFFCQTFNSVKLWLLNSFRYSVIFFGLTIIQFCYICSVTNTKKILISSTGFVTGLIATKMGRSLEKKSKK